MSSDSRPPLKPWPCPNCGSRLTSRIEYGLPRGPLPKDLIHGGCVPGPANLGCQECGHWWSGPSSEELNEDWPKLRTWDLGDIGIESLLHLLGSDPRSSFEDRQEAIRRFMRMPAARPMPEELITKLRDEGYLANSSSGGASPTEKARAAVETIASVFAERFSTWGIVLPPRALKEREPGRIRKAGWHINYIFGLEGDEPYLEYYASHRMTSDSRERIYGSGRTESLRAIQEFVFYGPKKSGDEEKARRDYEEHNRRVAEELRSLGLFPEDDINAHLRTNPELSGRRKDP